MNTALVVRNWIDSVGVGFGMEGTDGSSEIFDWAINESVMSFSLEEESRFQFS